MAPPTANEIMKELLLRVSNELPAVWLWRSNRFEGDAIGAGGKKRRVSAGINGQGDASGLIAPSGRRIEAEVKATYEHGRDRQSPVQQAFQKRIERMGGVYMLVEHVGWTANGKPDLDEFIERLRKVSE